MRALVALSICFGLSACLETGAPEQPEPNVEETIAVAISQVSGEEVAEANGPKLFGFLRPKASQTSPTSADITIVTADAGIKSEKVGRSGLAALFSPRVAVATEPATSTDAMPASISEGGAPVEPKVGFLGRLTQGGSAGGTESAQSLPFGSVGTACGLPKKDLGKQVDKFPSSGLAKWKLYDTEPTSTQPRVQYITGFSDGCARQFTASLTMFGSPALHEIHRYGAAQKNVPYSASDKAYEKVKAGVCGVGRGKSCPASKAKTMERNTSFVTVYQQFGSSGARMEMFLYNGKIVASETRKP